MAAKKARRKSTSKAAGKDRRVRNEDREISVKDYPTIQPHLSKRELEVALAMGEGMTCPEASGALGVSVETVRSYVARLRDKTGLRRKAQLCHWSNVNDEWLQRSLKEAEHHSG